MTRDEAIARICSSTTFTPTDMDGFLAASPDEQAAMIKAYDDAKVQPGPSAGDIIIAVLKETAELAGYVIPLEGALAGAIGIGKS